MPSDPGREVDSRDRRHPKVSGEPVGCSVTEHLLRVAVALVAVALAFELTVRVVMRLLPQLIGMVTVVAIVAMAVAIHRYRRSHW